jgi:SAM-dependent methyltransferase
MLVMAIEAARQLSTSLNRKVSGYRIRDLKIEKALRIPPVESGIEVEFYLQTLKGVPGKFLQWSSFRLCAYENEEWSEICRGEVAVEFQDQVDEKEFEQTVLEQTRLYNNGEKRCTISASSETFYQHCSTCGISYGPTFKPLRNVRFNYNGESTAMINFRHWAQFSTNKTQSHVIHPSALDGLLQLPIVPFTAGGTEVMPILMPTMFRSLWVAAGDENYQDRIDDESPQKDQEVLTYTKSLSQGSRYEGAFLALDAETKAPRCIGQFTSSSAGFATILSDSLNSKEGHCRNLIWKPDPNDLLESNFEPYFSADSSFVPPVPDFLDGEKHILILWGLHKLIKQFPNQETVQHQLYLRKYLAWAELYTSQHKDELERVLESGNDMEELCTRVENNDPEGQLIVRVLRTLALVLLGGINPLEVLFRDGLATRYYQFRNDCKSAFANAMMYVDILAHKNPTLKVLEIGAGTGSATAGILETLGFWKDEAGNRSKESRFSDYTFTDISPSFFEAAKERFKEFQEQIIFSTLDIERPPTEQGFESGTYDLVIASNVTSLPPYKILANHFVRFCMLRLP